MAEVQYSCLSEKHVELCNCTYAYISFYVYMYFYVHIYVHVSKELDFPSALKVLLRHQEGSFLLGGHLFS